MASLMKKILPNALRFAQCSMFYVFVELEENRNLNFSVIYMFSVFTDTQK